MPLRMNILWVLAIALGLAGSAVAENWPQFRGPDHQDAEWQRVVLETEANGKLCSDGFFTSQIK